MSETTTYPAAGPPVRTAAQLAASGAAHAAGLSSLLAAPRTEERRRTIRQRMSEAAMAYAAAALALDGEPLAGDGYQFAPPEEDDAGAAETEPGAEAIASGEATREADDFGWTPPTDDPAVDHPMLAGPNLDPPPRTAVPVTGSAQPLRHARAH